MMVMMRSPLCVVLCCVIAACGPSSEDNPGGVDGGFQTGCTDESQCSAAFPICTASGYCVECESSADCSEDRPICGNGTCMASCAGEEVVADFVTLPSDIIWVVDQSGSMNQETQYVQAQINTFASEIGMSGIDYRVVMIAGDSGGNAICVPQPLAGPSCGDNTRFKLVDVKVGSTNGPQLALNNYAQYSSFLRLEAMKHFIFVTDDNSAMSAKNFTDGLAALTPAGMFDSYKVHGIYGRDANGQKCSGAFGAAVNAGPVYHTLITDTGGASGIICEDDWTDVFMAIQAAVVAGSQVSCQINIPQPSDGSSIDPSSVSVKYLAGGVAPGTILTQVSSEGACDASGGWYYDDPNAPTMISLCPASCGEVQADDAASVKIDLGCANPIL